MIPDGQFVAFLVVSAILIITPGPDMALVLRNALVGGRRSGIFTGFGVCTGQMVWVVASCVGVAALLAASEPVFLAIKLFGAAYLVYLGIQSLWSALCRDAARREDVDHRTENTSSLHSYRQGLVSNLGNPKMAVFFTSLLPQFATGGGTSFFVLLVLGTIFCLMTLIWLVGYATIIARAGNILRKPRIRRAVESITGAVLVALGLRLATETR